MEFGTLLTVLASEEETCLDLEATGSWPKTRHFLGKGKEELRAVLAAVASGRPLLVQGEPGVGKSQLARAAAQLLGRHLLSYVVQPSTDYQDLLWTFDHLGRLAEAQLLGAAQGVHTAGTARRRDPFNPDLFLSPGPFWWACDWTGAKALGASGGYTPEPMPAHLGPDLGLVLLLDEIDKAAIDLPNGLLEVLGNHGFSVPNQEAVVARGVKPLVVVTSNQQRDLPWAFVRRCVVLNLVLPAGPKLEAHLKRVGRAKFPALPENVIEEAARQTVVERESMDAGGQRVGQAEFLDLLQSLEAIGGDEAHSLKDIEGLRRPILQKHTAALGA